MRKTLLSFLCLLCSINAFADHFMGAKLKYSFDGSYYNILLEVQRDCRGISLGSTGYVTVSSASLGISTYKSLPIITSDTVNLGCVPGTSPCVNPTSINIGWELVTFGDTISLPPANDWVISFAQFARNASIVNLSSPFGAGIYVDATLDNSGSVNSNPVWPAKVNYYLVAGTPMSYPLQLVDTDGDSLDIKVVGVRENNTGTAVPYSPGYSATSPFGAGGTFTVNTTTHTLDMEAVNPGMYALALEVDEYRGGAKIGSHTHDFTVAVLASGNAHTFPTPSATTNFTFYTCPGQTNTVLLNFDDVVADSVFAMLNAPSLSGWTFTPTYASGNGTGSMSLTYTAPVTLSPSATPYVLLPLQVRDNACPQSVVDFTIMIKTQTCMADSVWPGDANNDNVVNLYDPLYVALAYGNSGPSRPGATTTWVGQACSNWATSFPLSGTNHKHADCNGDGTVDASDFAPIVTNYGNTHLREGNRTTAGVPLMFDVSGINFAAGSMVSVPIKLGDASNNVNGLFGIATRVSVSGAALQTPIAIYNYTTWMGNTVNTHNFNQAVNNNTVDWVQSRIDNTSVNGDGTIGTLDFIIPASTPFGTMLTFNFNSTLLINIDGVELPQVAEQSQTVMVDWPLGVTNVSSQLQNATIVPNPSHNDAKLVFAMQSKGLVAVDIVDMTGKKVWHNEAGYDNGMQSVKLPTGMATGLYLIQLSNNGQKIGQPLKWNKQ